MEHIKHRQERLFKQLDRDGLVAVVEEEKKLKTEVAGAGCVADDSIQSVGKRRAGGDDNLLHPRYQQVKVLKPTLCRLPPVTCTCHCMHASPLPPSFGQCVLNENKCKVDPICVCVLSPSSFLLAFRVGVPIASI